MRVQKLRRPRQCLTKVVQLVTALFSILVVYIDYVIDGEEWLGGAALQRSTRLPMGARGNLSSELIGVPLSAAFAEDLTTQSTL